LTPRQETEIEVRLSGNDADVEKALAEWPTAVRRTTGSRQSIVAVPVSGQNEVDRLVDQLRAHRVSIASLSRQRKTLEDAFLELISQTGEVV
jgi:hypothetical protein